MAILIKTIEDIYEYLIKEFPEAKKILKKIPKGMQETYKRIGPFNEGGL